MGGSKYFHNSAAAAALDLVAFVELLFFYLWFKVAQKCLQLGSTCPDQSAQHIRAGRAVEISIVVLCVFCMGLSGG